MMLPLVLLAAFASNPWASAQNEDEYINFNYTSAAAADNATKAYAIQHLAGKKFRCVDYSILGDGVSLGDGFSRIRSNATMAQQRILNASIDTAVTMNPGELDGVNVWLMYRLAQLAGFELEIDVYKIPAKFQASADKTLSILYLLNAKNYDCVVTATQLFAYRQAYMTYITPTQPFGYIVTTLEGSAPVVPLLHRFWTWRTPFSDEVWGVLAVSLVVVGWFMWFFERCDNEDDFGHHIHTPWYEQIWNGVYLAFAGFTSKTEEFSPKTLPGRFLGMIHAFAIFLTVSFYIANLATVFISAPAPDQPIKGIKSFSQLDTPACVGNKTAFTDFMKQAHPEVKVFPVSQSVTGVLDALVEDDPPCAGGVMTDVLFQFETGPVADPNGKYCAALMIGPQMGTNYYAIPFAINTNSTDIIAVNILVSNLIFNGEYAAVAAENFFVERPQCQDVPGGGDSPTLSIALEDFSGVFLVQIIGIVAALLLWFVSRTSGFAHLKLKKGRGKRLSASEDVGCLRYFFQATPAGAEDTIPDDVKAIHEIRNLLDQLEMKVKMENGSRQGGSPKAKGGRDSAPSPPHKIVVELSSGSVGLD